MNTSFQWVECPRDAMQGISTFIPTEQKIAYLQSLLEVGFHTIDAVSFVSAKAIPQMADAELVLQNIIPFRNSLPHYTNLLAIVANVKGAERAAQFGSALNYIGYPLSISETFQQNNTNRSLVEAWNDLTQIASIAEQAKQKLVVYLSMGFGNPYGDIYNEQIVADFCTRLLDLNVEVVSLSDTIGVANPTLVSNLFSTITQQFKSFHIGAHFHVIRGNENSLIEAAYQAGCQRFDTAYLGIGGCPLAHNDLVGNLSTEFLWKFLQQKNEKHVLQEQAYLKGLQAAQQLF